MKKIIVISCAIMACMTLSAQDIIITNDAKKIDAKILEVYTSEVRYKELDNLDGPIFILRADEINSIIYANGKVVLYNKDNEDKEVIEVARNKKEAEAIAKANNFGNLWGKTTEMSVDSGTVGEERKGNPVGVGSSGSGSWSLAGRGIKGNLPQPSKDFKEEGSVIVQVRVNAVGQVTNATVTGGTVKDKKTQQLALDAARKAKFSESDHDQIGTITYIFKLN